MPSLCSSAPMVRPVFPLRQESGKLFTVYLGEDGKEAGDTGIRDPHLLAIEQVMLAIGVSVARARMFIASEPADDSERA